MTRGSGRLALRPMRSSDLALVRIWLAEPHVARWYLSGSTIEQELADLRRCVTGEEPAHALMVLEGQREIGWCQWYRCSSYPDHAAGVGAGPEDVGFDYAIGAPDRVGHGLGVALIGALVARVREVHLRGALIADPEAANVASRRTLEKSGFTLVDVRPVPSERTDAEMAIYRLPAAAPG